MTKVDNTLVDLRRQVLRMGCFTTDIVQNTVHAATKFDESIALSIIKEDEEIDNLRFALDDKLIQYLALHHPMGDDLREIISAMHICQELERIGDYCVNIAKSILKLSQTDTARLHQTLQDMGNVCLDMVEGTLHAYSTKDTDQAKVVSKRDDEIDAWYKEIEQHYERNYDRQPTTVCLHNVLMARYFERLADHVTNICEWTSFEKTGIHLELN